MTDMKEKARKVFSHYYYDPQHDPNLHLAATLREVINVLQVFEEVPLSEGDILYQLDCNVELQNKVS